MQNNSWLGSRWGSGSLLTHSTPSAHICTPNTSANTPAHYLLTYDIWPNQRAHAQQKHTHNAGGACMPTNGLHGPSGIVWQGGTQKHGMWKPQWAGNPISWHACQCRFFATAKRTTTNRQQKPQTKGKECKQEAQHRGIGNYDPNARKGRTKREENAQNCPKEHGQRNKQHEQQKWQHVKNVQKTKKNKQNAQGKAKQQGIAYTLPKL